MRRQGIDHEEVRQVNDDNVEIIKEDNEEDDRSRVASDSDPLSLLASKNDDFLLSPTGAQVTISDLQNKIIGLYFSANWYPPCRKFTHLLVNVYEQLNKDTINPGFEIIFVSSDEDLDSFNAYWSSMPWLAIPFSDLGTKRNLNRMFDVEGIPCLIILQPNSNEDHIAMIDHDGVDIVYRYGVQAFPFTKARLEELKKEEKEKHDNQTLTNLLTRDGRDYLLGHQRLNQVSVASLEGKTVGLYFSAQWCVPGFKFTPRLISVYQKIKQLLVGKEDEDFEVVFVSSDRDQVQFLAYFETMPWLAIPFDDPTIKDLTKYFDIRGIPSLVVLGPDGKTVTKQGRNLINLYQENAYPFTETRVGILEKQMEEEAKGLPKSEYHAGHRHELSLVSEGNGGGPFICCDCDEQGYGWAYQCLECGYEVHIKCVKPVECGQNS